MPIGVSARGGFALGPVQNEFATDAARNTYATANASWLALYNGDRSFWIRVGGAAGEIQRRNTAGTAWEEVTPVVSGETGVQGDQGLYYVEQYTNASTPPGAAPTGGSVVVTTGALTPSTGYESPATEPGAGEETYASRAQINPKTQTGTVTPVWGFPFEVGSPAGAQAAQAAAEAAATRAETAETGSETAQTAAEVAETDAVAARDSSQTARTGSEAAQTAAETAQASAETSADGAETSRLGAVSAAAFAEASRVAAEAAATEAAAGGGTGTGGTGWSPQLSIEEDGDRRVFQVEDWVGGTGTKPTTGQYVGDGGLVDDIADGVDIVAGGGLITVDTNFDDETLHEDTANQAYNAAAWNAFTVYRALTADDDENYLELSLRGSGGNQWESYLIPADLFRLQAFNVQTTGIGVNWQMKSTRGNDQVGANWTATAGFPHSVVRLAKRTATTWRIGSPHMDHFDRLRIRLINVSSTVSGLVGGGSGSALTPLSGVQTFTEDDFKKLVNVDGDFVEVVRQHHTGHGQEYTTHELTDTDFLGFVARVSEVASPTDGQFVFNEADGYIGGFEQYRTSGVTGWFNYDPFAAGEPWENAPAAATFSGALTYAGNTRNERDLGNLATAAGQVFALTESDEILLVDTFTVATDDYDEYVPRQVVPSYFNNPRAYFWLNGQTQRDVRGSNDAAFPFSGTPLGAAQLLIIRFAATDPNKAYDDGDALYAGAVVTLGTLTRAGLRLPAGRHDLHVVLESNTVIDIFTSAIWQRQTGADDRHVSGVYRGEVQ